MRMKIFLLVITTLVGLWDSIPVKTQTPTPILLSMEDVVWQKEGLNIWSLNFSPTHPYVAVGMAGEVGIYDIQTGQEITKLICRAGSSVLIQFSDDGNYLFSGDSKGQLLKWNTENWDYLEIVNFNLVENSVLDLDYFNNKIAVGFDNYGLILFDAISGQKILEWKDMPEIKDPKFPRHAAVTSVSFRYDGKVIAIGMKDAYETWLFDIETQQIIKKIKGEDGQYSPTRNELIVKKINGDLLDGLDYYKFDVSEIPTNLDIGELSKEINFIFDNEGNKIIISGRKSNIKFFNLYNSQQSNEFIYEPGGSFIFLALSADNRYFASAHFSKIIMLDALEYLNVPDNIIIDFIIYPNPSQNSIILQYFLEQNSIVNISISDLQGIIISNIFSGFQEQGQHNLPFSTVNLASGHYFITIESNGQVISLPFEIVR